MTASLLASPIKLLLWNRHFGTHNISPETEAVLADFIRRNELRGVKVRINQFAPVNDMRRLFTYHEVGLLYRIIGIPTTLITSLTGRLLGGLVFSDFFNPFNNTMNIYSNDIAIALHEAGHVKDHEKQRWKGTYALLRSFPGVDIAQELIATHEAFDYLELYGSDKEKIRAPRVLYPAFGTYAGGYLSFVPFAWVGALLGGHFYGALRSKYKREEIEAQRSVEKFKKPRPAVQPRAEQVSEVEKKGAEQTSARPAAA